MYRGSAVKFLQSAVRTADASGILNLETYTREDNLVLSKSEGERLMVGRVLEAAPLVGGGAEFGAVLNSALRGAPDDSVLQLSLLCVPDFDAPQRYTRGKTAGNAAVAALVERQRLVLESALQVGWRGDVPMLNRRTLVASLAVPVVDRSEDAFGDVARQHAEFLMNMKTSGFPEARVLDAAELAALYRQYTNPFVPRPQLELDELVEYKRQIFGPDQVFDFRDARVGQLGASVYCQAVVVKFYPERPVMGLMNLVSGGPFNEGPALEGGGPRILTPFVLSTTVRVANQRKESVRVARAIESRRSKKAPFKLGNEDPAAKLADLLAIQAQCADSEDKYVHVSTCAFVFGASRSQVESAASQLRGTFEKLKFDAREVTHNVGVRFAQTLPLNYSVKIAETLKCEVPMGSSSACAVMPLYGDYCGNLSPEAKPRGLPLVTRRGQLLEVELTAANISHGVIIGQTGSGKSLAEQAFLFTLQSQDAHVVGLDDGRTLKKFCHAVGGNFVEFGSKTGFKPSLNPFSFLDDALFEQEEGTIGALILVMAYDDERPDDGARIAVSESVKAAWDLKKEAAELNTVISALQRIVDNAATANNETQITRAASNLIPRLKAFVDSPSRGDYFRGRGTLDIHHRFTIFELGGIEDKHLKKCVMFYVMNMVISRLRHLPGRKFVFVDEAMDAAKDPCAASVLEGLYLKGRKDAVWVWTIWQSWLKLAELPAGQVVLTQSQWKVVLFQDPSEIEILERRGLLGRFNDDGYFKRLLRSLRTEKGDYSELLVISADAYEVGRLYLDRFTCTLLDSESDSRRRIFELMEAGVDVVEAVNTVLGVTADKRRRWIRELVEELRLEQGLTPEQVINEIRGVIHD
jgi:conjugal transfer ATP-binding protein TraC